MTRRTVLQMLTAAWWRGESIVFYTPRWSSRGLWCLRKPEGAYAWLINLEACADVEALARRSRHSSAPSISTSRVN